MNYAPFHRSSPGGLRRGGLLAVVLVLHGVAFAAMLTVRTVRPELLEMPLMVRFIDPPKPVEVALPVARALPMAAPEPPAEPPPAPDPPAPDPPKPKPVPKPVSKPVPKPVSKPAPRPVPKPFPKPAPQPASPREATSSSEPAPAAAIMVASEPAPATTAKSEDTSAAVAAAPAVGAGRGRGEGPVVGARFNAGYLNNPVPPYPPQSRRRGEEGKVILRVLVSKEGLALQVEVDTSSGSNRLDESALNTVRKWRFIPARRGGAAIDSWVRVPILFRLEQ
jgi:protein TonB